MDGKSWLTPTAGLGRRSGFSVIELLVVLAVLAVLGALLFLGIKSSRSATDSAVCVQNLKKIGQGMIHYTADNDGWFPPHWGTGPDGASVMWYAFLAPYITASSGKSSDPIDKVFFCPGSPSESRKGKVYLSATVNGNQSYGYNYFLLTRNYAYQSVFRRQGINHPSQVVLVADRPLLNEEAFSLPGSVGAFQLYPGSAALSPRHPGKRSNLLFIDGHIENVGTRRYVTPGEDFKVGNWDPRW